MWPRNFLFSRAAIFLILGSTSALWYYSLQRCKGEIGSSCWKGDWWIIMDFSNCYYFFVYQYIHTPWFPCFTTQMSHNGLKSILTGHSYFDFSTYCSHEIFLFWEKSRENKCFRNVASKLISTKCVAFRTFAVGNVCCNHFRVSNDPQGQLYVGWLRAWWKRVMGYKVPFELSYTRHHNPLLIINRGFWTFHAYVLK